MTLTEDFLARHPANLCSFYCSLQGILNRDKIVFMKARERRIPIVMLTSGGYQKSNARIIANSILNLANLGLIGPA